MKVREKVFGECIRVLLDLGNENACAELVMWLLYGSLVCTSEIKRERKKERDADVGCGCFLMQMNLFFLSL